MISEWECLIRAQSGDEKSCRVLFDLYQTRLTALALLITGSTAAAADVVQETFVRALRAKLRNTGGTVTGFLGTIAYRLAIKESKRSNRNVDIAGLERLDEKTNPLDVILVDERDRLVAHAIGSLDIDHRDALVLRFYGGHSFDEIAELLDIPLGTVKSRVFYAVRSCREKLRKKGVLE